MSATATIGATGIEPRVGLVVSYEDMANPPCRARIADIENGRWGVSYVLAWMDRRQGEVTHSDLRQNGWKVIA